MHEGVSQADPPPLSDHRKVVGLGSRREPAETMSLRSASPCEDLALCRFSLTFLL